MRLWMFAVALATPVMAVAQTAPTAAAETERHSLAVELASVLAPEARVRTMAEQMLNSTLPKVFANDPNMAAAERKSPGLTAEMLDVLSPIALAAVTDDMDSYWAFLTPAFTTTMTNAQMREVIAFYRGQTGQRAMTIVTSGLDFAPALQAQLQNPDAPITTTDMSRSVAPGVAAMIRELTPAEMAAVADFEGSPSGRALATALPKMNARVVEWMNRPDPAFDAKLDAALEAVFDRRFPKGH